MMRSLRGNFKITRPPVTFIDHRKKPVTKKKNKSSSPAKYFTEDRKYCRQKVIQAGIFNEKEISQIEKEGCGRVTGNGMVKYPFIGCRNILAELLSFQIIKGLKLLMKAVAADYGQVVVTEKYGIKKNIKKEISRSPNILFKTKKNRYPLGFNKILWRNNYRLKKNNYYFPGKKGNLVIGIEKLVKLYRFIELSSEDLKKYIIVHHNGSNHLFEVNENITIQNLVDRIDKDVNLILKDGFLTGRAVKNTEQLRPADFDNIILLKTMKYDLIDCTGCGKCVEICPQYLKVPHILKIFKEGRGFMPFSELAGCIGCGLCSYFCPGWSLR